LPVKPTRPNSMMIFPVFKTLCERLAGLNPGETFLVGNFIEEAKQAPYAPAGPR